MSNQQPWLVPEYPPLKSHDLVGKAAVENQIVYFPQVVRTMIDEPIVNQTVGIISFMLFKEPRRFKTGKPCYGYFKLRGNWATKEQAIYHGSKIVREVDSKYALKVAPIGHWLPITEEDGFVKEKIDIKTEESTFQQDAVRENEKERKEIMRQVREREKTLRESGDIYDDPESLRYYSMRRVTELRLTEARDKIRTRMQETEKSLTDVRVELKKLERSHPEYQDEWIDVYNKERELGGVPPFKPAEDLFEEYEQFKLPDSSEE